MELLLALLIVAVVALVVSVPLRRRAGDRSREETVEGELEELEARKRSRYREIRDAEADHATGKLSEEDFRRLDAELRSDAIEILKRMDRLRGRTP